MTPGMIPVVRSTTMKNGRVQPWFKTELGRVRTSAGAWRGTRGERTERMTALAEYGRNLIVDRALAGIGSNDAPMRPLRKGYAIRKTKRGLGNRRNLYGTGEDQGHMLDDVRTVFVDDSKFAIGITKRKSLEKARGNELKSSWWGWSPSDMRKLLSQAHQMMLMTANDIAVSLGLNAAIQQFQGGMFSRSVRTIFRRAA